MMIIGKVDNAVKDWLKNKERFADLFNGIVYGGEDVVKPEELTQVNSESSFIVKGKDGNEKSTGRRRDIIMNWNDSCSLVVLAVESQVEISYAMPVRNMLYDALAYTDQMKEIWNDIPEDERPKKYTDEFFSRFRKTDRLYPVITLVLYYGGSGEWDGGTSIHNMFNERLSKEQKKKLESFVPDYKINLVELEKIDNPEVFKSNLREVVGMIKCRQRGNKLREFAVENKELLSHFDIETRRVLKEVMNIKDIEKYVKKENGKEVLDMCKALEEIKQEGRIEGRMEGRIEGRIEAKIELIQLKIKKGKSVEDIAMELDDELANIQPIYNAIIECGVDADAGDIYKALEKCS